MNNADLFVLLFTGIWCLVGVVFGLVGAFLRRAYRRREERMSARTDGVVSEMARRGGMDGGAWFPIVEFTVDGRRVSLESDSGGRKRYYEGQSVVVRYDPDDPSCFQIEGDGMLGLLSKIYLAVGVGCVAIGLGVGFAVKGLVHF